MKSIINAFIGTEKINQSFNVLFPSLSFRWPLSILWLINVFKVTISPADAVLGTLTLGFTPFAIVISPL